MEITKIKIKPKNIVFDDKAHLKCFHCLHYGKKATCPPHIPDIDYKKLIRSYKKAFLVCIKYDFKNEKEFSEQRKDTTLLNSLLKLEKVAFNKGHHFTISFTGGSCKLCKECSFPCRHPEKSRIPMEAIGIDVVKTTKELIKFPVKDYFYRIGLFLC